MPAKAPNTINSNFSDQGAQRFARQSENLYDLIGTPASYEALIHSVISQIMYVSRMVIFVVIELSFFSTPRQSTRDADRSFFCLSRLCRVYSAVSLTRC